MDYFGKVFESHAHHSLEKPLSEAVKTFQEQFEIHQVEKVAFLSLPHHANENATACTFDCMQNLKMLYLKHVFSPNAYAFAHLEHTRMHLDDKELANDYLKQAEMYCSVGFDGMKMLEGYPSMRKAMGRSLCDSVYDKYYSFLEENGIPVVLHLANPEVFWDISAAPKEAIALGRVCDSTYPTKAQLHEEVDGIMKKHPKLCLTLAHFGFMSYNIEQAKRFLDEYEYTALDTTPGDEQFLEMLKSWDEWQEFFVQYQDRIIYGSDFYPFTNRRPTFLRTFFETEGDFEFLQKSFRGVRMEQSILDKIYRENMERRVGQPKKIDLEYMRSTAIALKDAPQKHSAFTDEDIDWILKTL